MNCDHPTVDFVPTPEGPHYGKEICTVCGRFAGWRKKPETEARILANGKKHTALEKMSGDGMGTFSAWDKQFLGSIGLHLAKLSPKQQQHLDRIAETNGL